MSESLDGVEVLFDGDSDGFWSDLEKVVNEGRTGTVLKIEFGFGWKVFTGKDDGFDHSESLFKYEANSPNAKELMKEAKKKANRFVVENALDKNPYNVFYIHMMKDTCLNKELTWKDDRWFFTFPGSYAYTELIVPALKNALSEAGIPPTFGTFWASIVWGEDRGAKKMNEVQKKDEEGHFMFDENGDPIIEKRWPLIAYPTVLFTSKDAALEYCGDSVVDNDSEDSVEEEVVSLPIPDGYDDETWNATVQEIKSELEKGTKAKKIASDYGLDVSLVEQIQNS